MVLVQVARTVTSRTMAVTTEDGKRYSLYSSPTGFSFGENAQFGSIAREGLKPITRLTGPGVKTLSFTHRISSLDPQASIEDRITPLTRLAKEGRRVRFVGGSPGYEQGVWWNIKSLDLTVTQRSVDNRISRAELAWTLEESADVAVKIVRPVPKRPAPAPKPPAARQHRVVRGDTLWDLAAKYLGNPLRWPEIFRLNAAQIKNPHWIYPGQLFRIPAR